MYTSYLLYTRCDRSCVMYVYQSKYAGPNLANAVSDALGEKTTDSPSKSHTQSWPFHRHPDLLRTQRSASELFTRHTYPTTGASLCYSGSKDIQQFIQGQWSTLTLHGWGIQKGKTPMGRQRSVLQDDPSPQLPREKRVQSCFCEENRLVDIEEFADGWPWWNVPVLRVKMQVRHVFSDTPFLVWMNWWLSSYLRWSDG